MSVQSSSRCFANVVRLVLISSIVLLATIAGSATSPTSHTMRPVGVLDVVDPTAATPHRVAPAKAAMRPDSQEAAWLQFQESREVGREQPLGSGQVQSRSAASADLNWDSHPDLVVGSSSGVGGLVAIHLASPEAFGPHAVETLKGIAAGRFPESFLPDATVYAVPEAADFVAVGDFDRDGRVDLLTARRGGSSLYLLSNNGNEGFETAQAIAVPGSVTALVAGRFDPSDEMQDLAVAIAGPAGPRVLVFASSRSLTDDEPLAYPVPSEATVLVAAELDDTPFMDLAVLAGGDVFIVHGAGKPAQHYGSESAFARSQVERVRGVGDALSLAVGDFVPERESRNELAMLSDHGDVSFVARGTLDTRPMTEEEIIAGRQLFIEARERNENRAGDAAPWKQGDSEPWSEVRRVTVSSALLDGVSSRPLIVGANVAAQPGDELLVLDPTSDQLQIVSIGSDWQKGESGEAIRTVALDAGGAPIAALPMRLGVLAQPGLIVLSEGHSGARAILPKVAATFMVTKTADTNDGTCNADCSVREAIVAANASAGADMITFAAALNTFPIQLTRIGDDNTAVNGDLDINDDVTILGNGASNTLIQGSSNAGFTGNMGDKAIGINQDGTHTTLNVSISNLTVRFTRNDIATNPGFTQTGGSMDIFLTGTGAMPGPTTSLTNCTFDSNASALSYGGGINIDSGSLSAPLTNIYRGTVQMSGCTFSNNRTLNATPTSDPPNGGGVNLFSDRHDVTFSSCSFTGNQTSAHITANGGGLNIRHSFGGTITLTSCTVVNNTSGSDGGGILIAGIGGQTVNITGGSITGNTAQGTGDSATAGGIFNANPVGGTTLSGVTVSSNVATAGPAGVGGGIVDGSNSPMSITNCVVDGNASDSGGGIATINAFVSQLTTIAGCTISNNSATTGGGLFVSSGSMNASLCRIVGNTAGTGSGIAQTGGTALVENNWWGCDGFPGAAGCQTGSGAFDADPRLDLRLTAGSATLGFNATTTLTASFATNSNNLAVNPVVMNGLTVTFATPAGSVSPTTPIIASLQASTTFTAPASCPSPNPVLPSATVDNGTQTVGITVQQPPGPITCPANITVGNTTGQCGAAVTFATPTATGCPVPTVTCVPASGSTFAIGTTTVTCTATNGVLPNTTCTFTVTVNDTQAPTVTCPANITQPATAGQCSATVTYTTPTASDNCPGATVACVPASGATFPLGATTVTCTASDASANSPDTTCTFTVTVQDTQAPTVTCPANITQPNTAGQCSRVLAYTTPTGADNCPGVVTVSCVPASGSTFVIGTTTVTCTASDTSANSPDATCTFTVTIQDTQAPTVSCPANITQPNTAGQCSRVVTYTTPTASDNCPGSTVNCVPASGSTFPVGATTVTCTATDASANTGTCSFTVTIQDTQAPSVTCPANITQPNTAGQCSRVVTYTTPTGTDNCPGVVTVSCVPASGATFPVGVTTVTCTAADVSANSPDATCSFTVTIQDTQAPTVVCPANITQPNTAGQCSRVVTYTTPTASDNCPGATVNCVPASGATFPVGTTTVTCTATDASSNTGSCTFTVTIQDTQAPTVTCPSNITVVESPPSSGSATVTYTTPTASDNCPGATVNCSPASGTSFPVGTTTVTCTATDASANTGACTFTITVQPACTITCPANVTVPNTTGQCGANVTYAAPTTTGNCGTITCTPSSGSFFAVGTTTVNCTTGTGPTCSFTVTVQDTQAPVANCPAPITVSNTTNQCSAVVTYTATATDNCPGATIVCTPASGSTFPVGSTTVTCTASDASPNSTDGTCTFSVTVQDTQAPAITCPANLAVPKTPGQCSTTVSYTVPTATDNCPGATSSCTPTSGSTFPVGVTTVTCTAEDASANSPDTTCTFTITVTDTTAPVITCPANVTVPNTTGQCSAAVAYAAPPTTDNCPGTTVVCTPASGSTFNVGTTTVNCTATDASNNTSTCSFTVTVQDTQAPVATCPAPITTAAAAGTCSAVVTYTATATDNCPGVTIVCAPASGSTFPVGVTTVNCTASDASPNSPDATCAFTVTVNDTQLPVITCPANIVVTSNTTNGCTFSQVVNYPAPTATDNCGLGSVVCVPPSGSTFQEGTTTVVCTATDTSGNTAACSFTVTVGASFGFCAVDDASGDRFQMVVDPASPSYKVWRYTIVATGQIICGRANNLSYFPGIRLVASDNDYSAENPTFFMNASFKGNNGTVTVRNVRGTISLTLRDRNTLDSVCP